MRWYIGSWFISPMINKWRCVSLYHHYQIRSVNVTQWASYQIRKIAGCACAGNAGNVFPRRRFQRKPLVSDPGMHHGTCVTHVPWCMSGSRTRGGGENVPGIPGACAPAISRIWQEAHFITFLRDSASNMFVSLFSFGRWTLTLRSPASSSMDDVSCIAMVGN